MTRHRDLLESPLLARRLAIFTDAERVIADPVVRNRGTIGGALCQADPSEDLSAVCAAVGAQLVIRGLARRARRRHARVPPRPVRDGGRAGRDAGRDPRPAARGRRQRLPQGRPARRRLGGRRRRGVDRDRRRRDRARRHRAGRGRRRHHLPRPQAALVGEAPSRRRCSRARPQLAAAACRADHRPARIARNTNGTSSGVLTERATRGRRRHERARVTRGKRRWR